MIGRADVTGLVLAGGRGSRMGGADKGLQQLDARSLVQHAIDRLAPQVGGLLISANRHVDAYEALGHAVVADTVKGQLGPLAGFLAGLERCNTPYLATVPCDAPHFPTDLVARLAAALDDAGAAIAIAATHENHELRRQPAFCLMRADVRADLARHLAGGGRKVSAWADALGAVVVAFDDVAAFANINTLDELQRLQQP